MVEEEKAMGHVERENDGFNFDSNKKVNSDRNSGVKVLGHALKFKFPQTLLTPGIYVLYMP